MPDIAIVDYGMGNLHSVANAISAVGGVSAIVSNPRELNEYEKIILPGVGAFSDAMLRLENTGLAEALTGNVRAGKSILGICLGMQLMCLSSEEGGEITSGLGWFDAHVKKIPALNVKIPHIGWNSLRFNRSGQILDGLQDNLDVYFVHSYRVECNDDADVLAWCDYGEPFAAMISRGKLCGMQFHPEKSQRAGLTMMKNFVESSRC